jgi:uncharacterized protein YuzE
MKVRYFEDTDTLYIDLAGKPAVESEEVSPGLVLDFDGDGLVVGIEIEAASRLTDLSTLEGKGLGRRQTGPNPHARSKG